MEGIANLVRNRGTEAHMSPLRHRLLLFVSYLRRSRTPPEQPILFGLTEGLRQIMESIVHDRSNYLSESDWPIGPWRHLTKSHVDCILDSTSFLEKNCLLKQWHLEHRTPQSCEKLDLRSLPTAGQLKFSSSRPC